MPLNYQKWNRTHKAKETLAKQKAARKVDRRKKKTKHYPSNVLTTSRIKKIDGVTILMFKELAIGDQFYVLKQQKDRDGNYYFRRQGRPNLYTKIVTTKSVMTGYNYNATVSISHRPTKGYFQSFTRVVKVVDGKPVEIVSVPAEITEVPIERPTETFADLNIYDKFYIASDSIGTLYQKIEDRFNKQELLVNAIDCTLISEVYIKPDNKIVKI